VPDIYRSTLLRVLVVQEQTVGRNEEERPLVA
jgi:hypothetical protein